MNGFWQLCRENPLLSFIIVCAVYYTLKWLFRSINVAVRGWPPSHLDADGDFAKRDDE